MSRKVLFGTDRDLQLCQHCMSLDAAGEEVNPF